MQIVITGGAGFIGRKLAHALAEKGTLTDAEGRTSKLRKLILLDTHEFEPEQVGDVQVTSVAGDICDAAMLSGVITDGTTAVYHLAAVVSAQAEADFDLGMRVNLDGTRTLLEACRALSAPVKFITTSSVAAYGGTMPAVVPDDFSQMPQNSYGMQKAVSELLVNDYSRRGFVDGRVIRLPTIIVRPGKPNAAASSFASGILREPLQGEDAVCPVGKDTSLWVMSPRKAVEGLVHAHELSPDSLGHHRSLMLPGISVTVEEMITALEEIAGKDAANRVTFTFDQAISDIVNGWPGAFEARRGLELGFPKEGSISQIIKAFIEDDMVRKQEKGA